MGEEGAGSLELRAQPWPPCPQPCPPGARGHLVAAAEAAAGPLSAVGGPEQGPPTDGF